MTSRAFPFFKEADEYDWGNHPDRDLLKMFRTQVGNESMSEPTPNPLQNGDLVLDRYRVERGIAQGGHSLVYLGADERLSRPVCIKAFHKLGTEKGIWDTAYDHFVQEAFALSKLSHPNTLRIYDFGHLDGRNVTSESGEHRVPVQVSEFMGGGTLASVVHSQGPLPTSQALSIISKLAHALGEAHRLSIVHRDIKPQNILFTSANRDREPKLADFGIAKSVTMGNLEHQAEETQVVVGFPLAMYSPSWAAPEQLNGAPAAPPADVFSLALLAVYALSGKAICKGANSDEAHDRREKAAAYTARALSDFNVAPAVVRVLQESCAYRAGARPQDAEEFASALDVAMRAPRISRRDNTAPRPPITAAPAPATPQIDTPAASGPTDPPPPAPVDPSATHLRPSQQPQRVGAHTFQFVEMQDTTTLHWGDTRAQFSITPTPGTSHNMTVTVKGLTTFVANASGRPTRAVHLSCDGYVDLLTPTKLVVGRLRVAFGSQTSRLSHFLVGNTPVCLEGAECPCPVLVDCPGLNYSYILYGSGSATRGVAPQRHIP